MGCLSGCKYGRKSSSHHDGALHSSFLASSSLNRPTQFGTDDWAEPGGSEGPGEAPETDGWLRFMLARKARAARTGS